MFSCVFRVSEEKESAVKELHGEREHYEKQLITMVEQQEKILQEREGWWALFRLKIPKFLRNLVITKIRCILNFCYKNGPSPLAKNVYFSPKYSKFACLLFCIKML